MNVNGQAVAWCNNRNDVAIVETDKGYVIYVNILTKNRDGTAFRSWMPDINKYEDIKAAINNAKSL